MTALPTLGAAPGVRASRPLDAVMAMLGGTPPASSGCSTQDSPVAGFAAMVAAALAGEGAGEGVGERAETAVSQTVTAGGTGAAAALTSVAQPGIDAAGAPASQDDEASLERNGAEDTAVDGAAGFVPAIVPAPRSAIPVQLGRPDALAGAVATDAAPSSVSAPIAAAVSPSPGTAGAAPGPAGGAAQVAPDGASAPAASGDVAPDSVAAADPTPASTGTARAVTVAPEHAAVHRVAAGTRPGSPSVAQTTPPAAGETASAMALPPSGADAVDDVRPVPAQPWAGAPVDASAPAQAAGPAAVAAVAATAATTAPDAAGAEARVVASQVLPEVAELTRRGPGVHRVTLQLHPETLGEVKVVLTMRGGEVHVSLAAGQEARGALRESLPELQRLLEGSGVRDAQVALRELASATPTASAGGAGHQQGQQPGQQTHPGQAFGVHLGDHSGEEASAFAGQRGAYDRAPGQQDGRAGTRGDGRTTEGSLEGPQVSPVAPVARAVRDAGVDLVM